jgi:hypothetical protein
MLSYVQKTVLLQFTMPTLRLNLTPWVDVMITIFCDFGQFSPKKLALFPKSNVMIRILQKQAVF